jgi:alanyl-tRNA synthetase
VQANELRRAFLGYFEERGHTVVPSASLIPHDATVLFTIAGMVPFAPFLTGEQPAPYPRATSVQKCVRAGGKQNDLDEVGRTTRHLSFFEMCGNFSFGDYFKDRAIPLAWAFLTETLGLDPERLWITVHVSDDDAERIWRDDVGVAAERIQRLDEDNFWRMGDTGPCGPCSEIFWDKGPEYGADGGPAHGGEERFVEIWNLVFMQFERQSDGSMVPLPKPSIDTGFGLERNLAVLQGVDSVFDTDELARLIARAAALTGAVYRAGEASDVSLRILAEHARTMTFLVSDGVFPSNEDRGYVLRRIMRRAVRHAYLLGVDEVVTPPLVDEVVAIMGDDYPELRKNHDFVRGVVEREETRFRQTLRTGSVLLEEELGALPEGGMLDGRVAFTLHDTYGFPLEVTQEIASERGFEVDDTGFQVAMDEQRSRAKDARKAAGPASGDVDRYHEVLDEFGPTEFTGRIEDESTTRVLAVTDVAEAEDGTIAAAVFLDHTPFYAESGGQVGDTGTISTDTGRAEVLDTTYALPGLHRHSVRIVDGVLSAGQVATAAIDVDRRNAIRRNHTATHLLHWGLRQVLGDHVKQQGSLVTPDRLRFDFSHYEAVTPDELVAIEDLVNREILANDPVRHYETTKANAEAVGAIAFFGDKYGDIVRVLEAGRHSVELCGGTHVRATGDIGPVKIVSEGSIGSNLRRIEALTGTGPIERLRREEAVLAKAASLLGVPPDELVEGVEKRLTELKATRDELKALRRQAASGRAAELAALAVDGVVVARVDGVGRDDLRDLTVAVRDLGVRAAVLGGAPEEGGVALVAAVTKDSGFEASALIADAARTVKGGGGKSPDLAVAGGKDVGALDEALEQVRAAAGLA